MFIVLLVLCLSGCLRLNTQQSLEHSDFEREGVLVNEKSELAGVLFGILPGGGSFYTGQTALGVIDLLLWPYSILWDPAVGYEGARYQNYHATKWQLKKQDK